VGKKEPSYTADGNVNYYSHCGKQYGVFSKKLKTHLSQDPVILLLGIYPNYCESAYKKGIYATIFIEAPVTIVPRCSTTLKWVL
jgi:hypothetical protein